MYTRRRWPLFRPLAASRDWFATYSALVESSFCLTCVNQMAEVIPADYNSLALREKRLVHDLRLLVEDPPPGIKAQPLDSSNYHWQASVTGPAGSPYEGGIFFLYLKVGLASGIWHFHAWPYFFFNRSRFPSRSHLTLPRFAS